MKFKFSNQFTKSMRKIMLSVAAEVLAELSEQLKVLANTEPIEAAQKIQIEEEKDESVKRPARAV